MKRVTGLFLIAVAALFLTACPDFFTADLNSPMDPEAESYQGYTTVDDVNAVEPALADGAALDFMVFPISEVIGADIYRLQIASAADFSIPANLVYEKDDFTTPVMAATADLTAGITYFWRGAAHEVVWGNWTAVRSFTMNDFSGRDPTNGASTTDTTPELSWNAVTGAVSYEVQIADTQAGVEDATAVTVTAPDHAYTWSTELSDGDELHWRVKAIAAGGTEGAWSSIAMVTYEPPPWADPYWTFQPVIASGSTATFSMGSTASSDEQPIRTVTLTRPYHINTYEVTNDQFAAVMNAALDRGWVTASTSTVRNVSGNQQELLDVDSSYCRIDYTGGELVVNSGYGDHPVTEVTWYGAVAFAYYLNALEGKEQTYSLTDWSVDADATGYRLPSEAEWEYAARGGADSGGYTYAGSNDAGTVAWYYSNSGSTTHTVGTKAANEIGTYDMSGNVWEWVQDWYDSSYYSSSPGSDPEGSASGTYRVLRGGSWAYGTSVLRVALRNWNYPYNSYVSVGFRLVVSGAP